MGPSGCGKSTFMKYLSGQLAEKTFNLDGSVYLGDVKNGIFKCPSEIGFVPQDDIVHEDLTVEDMIKRSFSEFSSQRVLGSKDLPALLTRGMQLLRGTAPPERRE